MLRSWNGQGVSQQAHSWSKLRSVAGYACLFILPHVSIAFPLSPPSRRVTYLMSLIDKNGKIDVEEEQQPSVTGVTLKMAFDSSDVWGVADLSEEMSERFTSPGSLDLVHRLRRCSDAVLVGRGTVERDNCTLTVRRVPLLAGKNQPVRVVLDPNQSLFRQEKAGNSQYALLHDGLPTIIYHALDDSNAVALSLEDTVTRIALTDNIQTDDTASFQRYLSPTFVIRDLKQRGIHHVMVEGGPATARAFLQEGAIDRAILIRAPMCFRKPLASHISECSLIAAGLKKLGSSTCDGDSVEYWSKDGVSWPTADLEGWP